MKTSYVKLNEIYTVTTTADCSIYDANGSLIETCPANRTINIHARTNKLKLSDDNAAIKKAVQDSGVTPDECIAHIDNTGIHTTATEKANCANHIANGEIHVTADMKQQIDNAGLLVGEIKNYAGQNVPNGFLLCDGRAVSRTVYAALFAAIGTTWGAGDGSSTFNLPNLIDRVAWGASTAGEYLDAGLPNITGSLVITDENSGPAYLVVNTATGAFDKVKQSGELNLGFFEYGHPQTGRYTKTTFDASRSSAIYGKSSTVQPPAAKLIPIIKY